MSSTIFTDKRMGWNLFFSGIASLQQDGVRWPPNANFFILHILFYCVFIKMEYLPQYCVINGSWNLWGSLMDSEKCLLRWEAGQLQIKAGSRTMCCSCTSGTSFYKGIKTKRLKKQVVSTLARTTCDLIVFKTCNWGDAQNT